MIIDIGPNIVQVIHGVTIGLVIVTLIYFYFKY
jgi:hypothetical protein